MLYSDTFDKDFAVVESYGQAHKDASTMPQIQMDTTHLLQLLLYGGI